MTLARMRSWFNRLPPAERDKPLLMLGGIAYTPRAALGEVERGTPEGRQLQTLVESGRFGTTSMDEITIAKIRLKMELQRYPPDKPIVATLPSAGLPGRTYTPQELISEIESETGVGRRWIESESQKMRMLVSLR